MKLESKFSVQVNGLLFIINLLEKIHKIISILISLCKSNSGYMLSFYSIILFKLQIILEMSYTTQSLLDKAAYYFFDSEE